MKHLPVGVTSYMPRTDSFTMACFKASDVPVGTELYVAENIREMLTNIL